MEGRHIRQEIARYDAIFIASVQVEELTFCANDQWYTLCGNASP